MAAETWCKGETFLLPPDRYRRIPAGLELPGVITSNEALELDYIPRSMVIIGAGVVGIEFAGIFRSFGTEVTLVEFLRILPPVDERLLKEPLFIIKNRG